MRFRLLVLLALTVSVGLALPTAAHADGSGPTIDNASLSNGGRPCSSVPTDLNQTSQLFLQAYGTDPAAPQAGQRLTYTFAIWPTDDPSAEVDRTTTAFVYGLVTELGSMDLAEADYSWRVRLADVDGTSDWSQTCTFHNDSTAPSTPTLTSSNFPPGVQGPYGEPAQFTFDAHGDTDAVAFRYSLNGNNVVTTCSAGVYGQSICPDPSTWSDVVVADAPGGTAAFSVQPTQQGPNTLTVAAQDRAGNDSVEASYTFYVPSKLEPAPTIDGTPAIGQTLTASLLDWSPAPTSISYQWLANGSPIAAATGLTYVVKPSDVGRSISFAETGDRTNIPRTTENSNSLLILPSTFAVTPRPTISGTPLVGQVLSALPGAWSPAPTTFAYHWLRNGQPIAGSAALLHAYRLTAADAGAVMSVRVGGVRTGFTTVIEVSASTARVVAPRAFTTVATPRIVGTVKRGAVLTASMPTTPAAAYRYQWRLNNVAIAGQTRSRYVVRPTDVDRRISVVVTAVRAGYTSVQRASAPTAVVPGQAYPNCASLNAVYPHGVARAGVTGDRVNGVLKPFKGAPFFSTSLYNLNTGRDRDKDGIACEKR